MSSWWVLVGYLTVRLCAPHLVLVQVGWLIPVMWVHIPGWLLLLCCCWAWLRRDQCCCCLYYFWESPRCIIAGLSVIYARHCDTLYSSTFVGVRMALIALARLLMRWRPLGVRAVISVAVCNSLVSALRCALGLRFGTWQLLREEFDQFQNVVCSHLPHKVQNAQIVVSQRPQVPGIGVLRCPWSLYSQCFVDDSLHPGEARGYLFQL